MSGTSPPPISCSAGEPLPRALLLAALQVFFDHGVAWLMLKSYVQVPDPARHPRRAVQQGIQPSWLFSGRHCSAVPALPCCD